MTERVAFDLDDICEIVKHFIDYEYSSKEFLGNGNQSVALDNNNGTVSVYSICPARYAMFSDINWVKQVNKISGFLILPEIISIKKIADIEIINPRTKQSYEGFKESVRLELTGFTLYEYVMPKYNSLPKYCKKITDILSHISEFIELKKKNFRFRLKNKQINQDIEKIFFEINQRIQKVNHNHDIEFDTYTSENFLLTSDGKIVLLDLFISCRLGRCWSAYYK